MEINNNNHDKPRFVIESTEAESMAKSSGLTLLQLLPSLVKSAQNLARPPISKYHVGAVGLGSSGKIFIGVNLEFPGLPLHHSVHAEQFLATNLAINGEPHLNHFAVSAAPCGHCRQFLQEIRDGSNIQVLITSDEDGDDDKTRDSEFKPLSTFLPHRFGPDDLLDKQVPLLLEPHYNNLFVTNQNPVTNNNNHNDDDDDDDKFKLLTIEALEAANKAHSPYSKCPSGVAIMDEDGKVYKGSYTESAAYNPSLGPVQAAIIAYVVGCGGRYDKIVACVLVERDDALVKQEHTAKMLLQLVSPKCEFRVVHCAVKVVNGECGKIESCRGCACGK